ncbi:MAG: tetratricopeptide repeat protein [Acidobacteriota bacterium]
MSQSNDSLGPTYKDGKPPSAPQPLASETELQGLGPYRILETLGRGGMGSVYLAEQSEPIQRRVALKVMDAPLRDEESRRRFLVEQQSMAVMSHPNVAKIFDAGTSDTGWPYLAMEVIEGAPLTAFADEHRLSLRQRVAALVAVCRGVEHAHRKGILHRDLKPSNVLVESVDDEPLPKIIDFGVAKALDGSATQTLTARQTAVGTPRYMSPEALSGDGDLDTRSDVYSLGVMLFELLVGKRPFEDEGGFSEALVRNVVETDPPRPSTYYRKSPSKTQDVTAEFRSTTRETLLKQLSGDLGWVTWKALARDREERYASAADFAEDLEAWLEHRPVCARPPSLGYRLSMFARRHRGFTLAAALVLLALVLGVVGTAVGFVQARREAARANEEARTANQAVEFLEDLFEASSPGRTTADLTARELLDRGAERIREQLSEEPTVRARLLLTLARVYNRIGVTEESVEFAREAVELYERAPASEAALAKALEQLSANLHQLGDYREAITHAERSVELRRQLPDTNPSLVARTLQEAGISYALLAERDKAESLLLEALELLDDEPETNPGAQVEILNALGALRGEQGDAEAAEGHFSRAFEIQEARTEGASATLVGLLGNVAAAQNEQGKLVEAADTFGRAIRLATEVHGPTNFRVGNMVGNHGINLMRLGRLEEAEESLQQSHEILLAHHGDRMHYDVALSKVRLRNFYLETERFDEALQAGREAIEILLEVRGEKVAAEERNGFGYALLMAGRAEDAEPHLRDALRGYLSGESVNPRDLANVRSNLGRVRLALGDADEAKALLAEALQWREENLGPQHEETVLALRWHAASLAALGQRERALESYERAAAAPDEAMVYVEREEIERAIAALQ